MAKASPTIAATSTLAMVRAAESRGVDTGDLLAGAGLTRESLEDPDARIPAPTVLALWNALRERAADPVLQLVAPGCLPFGAYRVIDYLVGACATVGDGTRCFARYFRLISDAVTLSIDEDQEGHCLTLEMAHGGPVPSVYVDYVFAALLSRMFTRLPELRVRRVELRQPSPTAPAAYRELFRAPVHFGAGADRLCFSAEQWDAPMAGADAEIARLLEEHARLLAQRLPRAPSGFRAEVQKAIASSLSEGASAARVARALHVSVRTLQRKLVATGTTFQEMADTVRAELAKEYLSDRRVSIPEAAMLLGFSDESSFNRSFRRWTGEPPGRWRRLRG